MSSDDTAERPQLAPATWLVGRLDESALESPPWAVERAGLGYVQMGELAYHVAEQANGEHTVEEIAAAVSAALQRPVGVADVHALIHTVLVPRGVVTALPGDTWLPDEARPAEPPPRPGLRPAASRPPVHERVIGSAALERVAAVLMWLFWPPVTLVLAGLALAVLTWLFMMHGLAASVVDALAQPLLLLIALMLAGLLAGCLGPLGPLAALYSAGARIERLRVVLSLRQPRVVLDVTDDYGLSRWARLTVDVSAAYLQTVAALVFSFVAMAAGAEFLYLTVSLLALNALRLLLPFGRPGADRLLADLLLVPEPLRYAGQVLERWLPVRTGPARMLPPLKRWGWVAIWLYLLATAVVLAVVSLVVLRAAPTVVATILAALGAHISEAIGALGEREAVRFFGGLVRAGVLALLAFLLGVTAIVAVGRLVMAAIAWGQTSPGRRFTVAGCAVAGALIVLLFWVPMPRLGASANRTPRSLLGTTYRPLSPIARGALPDLFGGPAVEEATSVQADEPPSVTNPVNAPPAAEPVASPAPR